MPAWVIRERGKRTLGKLPSEHPHSLPAEVPCVGRSNTLLLMNHTQIPLWMEIWSVPVLMWLLSLLWLLFCPSTSYPHVLHLLLAAAHLIIPDWTQNSHDWNAVIITPSPSSFGTITASPFGPTHDVVDIVNCLKIHSSWPKMMSGHCPSGNWMLKLQPSWLWMNSFKSFSPIVWTWYSTMFSLVCEPCICIHCLLQAHHYLLVCLHKSQVFEPNGACSILTYSRYHWQNNHQYATVAGFSWLSMYYTFFLCSYSNPSWVINQ